MTQVFGPRLPCLYFVQTLLTTDEDTNYLMDLIPQANSRASITIDITRALHERMKNRDPLFRSLKQLEWALELLGYGFVPPQQQYFISSGNYLESILAVYEYVLCDKVVLELEGRNVEFKSVETVFDIKDPYYQTLLMKMLGHMTLLFDEKNFERKQGSMNSSQEFKAHEEEFKVPGRLCGIALKIIHKFIYRIYPFLSTSNWQNLIRLLTALTTFLLDTSTRVKTPERVNIAAVELMFNAWILSGLQDEELWALFKKVIYRVLHRSIVISYWVEICTELTIKLLVDEKCFNPPKLYVVGDKKQIEYQRKMLIIHHSIKDSTNEMEIVRSKSLFPQPFIFRISSEQTKYLWAKMVNLMHDANFTKDTKIHFMVAKGINNVVTLLLKLGRHHKFNDSINDPTKWLSMQTTRRVLIKHEFEYFRHLIKYLLQNDKVRAGPDDNLDDSMESNLSPVMKTPTMNASSTSVPTTISSFDTDSPLGKSASPKFQLKYSYIQDEPQWYIREHKAPDGETILKTFGKLLFESADPQITASQEARLVSLTTLSQIFMKAKGPFSDQSLRKFYKLLLLYMNSDVQRNYFQVLLKYSCQIFTSTNLRYYTYLQIAFIEKLINYHNTAKPENLLQKHEILLRNSASKFCSSAISPLLQDIQLINKEYMHGRNILNVLNELLTTSLLKDRDTFESPKISEVQVKKVLRSLSRSSWNLAIYSILTNKIGSFISKINDNWLEKPPFSSNKLVLDLFLSIGEVYLTRLTLDEDPIILNDVALAGNLILERVIGFLQNKKVALAEAPKSSSPQHSAPGQPVEKPWESVQVISSAFLVLYTWTLILMQIKEKIDQDNRREFIAMFFSTFNSLLAFSKIEPFTVYINNILSIISSSPGSIPFAKNLPFVGSILLNYSPQTLSLEKFNEELEQKNVIHIGINDDTILSFYDLSIDYIDEGFLLIIRNACGKTIWNSEVFYKLKSPSNSQNKNKPRTKSQVEKNKSHENPQDEVKNSDESFYEERHSMRKKSAEYEDLQQLLEEQFKSEEEYEIAFQQQTQQKPPENPVFDDEEVEDDDENDKVTNRLKKLKIIKEFLSNTGLISSKNIYELGVIPQDQETVDFFKQIDSISMRLQILVDILYVNDTKSTVIEALPNVEPDFNKFVDALGNVVSKEVLDCGAYETIRDYVTKYDKVIYSANSIYEILFNILNLSHKKNFLSENYETNSIVIIWNSRTKDIHNQTYPLLINKLQIKEYKTAVVITPLYNGQFCIDLLKHDQNFLAFPPVKGMVCNNEYLATFILQLIINIDREYQHAVNAHSCLENTFRGFKNRKKVISEFIHKHTSHPESVGQVLKSIFANDQTQEIPPQSNI